jgi:hypothetical protein
MLDPVIKRLRQAIRARSQQRPMHELPPDVREAVRPDARYAATVRELAAELDGGPLGSHLAWLRFAERMEAVAQQFTMDPSEVLAAVVNAPAFLVR